MFIEFLSNLNPYFKAKLLQNISKEWAKMAKIICPTKVFYTNNNDWHNKQVTPDEIDQRNMHLATQLYHSSLSHWIGQESSFGIISKFLVNTESSIPDQSFHTSSNDYYHGISFMLFCSKQNTHQMQQELTRMRNHWYRKLSKSPLNSGFESNLNENNNRVSIVYKPKQSKIIDQLHLDDIILQGESEVVNTFDQLNLIICRTNLDHCLISFLDDAFTVTADNQIVVKLHTSLIPFKLAITIEENTKEKVYARLCEVATYLVETLKDYNDITIYPFDVQKTISIESSDRLAIQYCAILKEETLRNGVIWLRNRDTRIAETVHIANFIKTILFYLQPINLINNQSVQSPS